MSCRALTESAAHHKAGAIHVRPGQKIQDAINAAAPGDEIIVEAGTYREQLLIQKDGISLVGHNAVIEPPENPKSNFCTGIAGNDTQAGICVAGRDVELAPFVVEHRKVLSARDPVKGVSVTGFHVRGFFGFNIAVVGTKDTQVTNNRLSAGLVYGFLTAGSIDTRISHNVVVSADKLGFIGVCMDNFRGVQATDNRVSGYQFAAFCVQTSGADVRNNDASGNCFGVFVDPAVRGAMIRGNHIGPSSPKCTGPGSVGVFGITIDSAIDTRVEGNIVEGQRNAGEGVGIAIIDDKCDVLSLACVILGKQAPIASGNVVVGNILRNNDIDLLLNTTGRNIVSNNKYSTSRPAKLP